jgi:hypothetical protein
MKRFVIFAMPILSVVLIVGFGAFLFRTRGPAMAAGLESVRKAAGSLFEEAAEELKEAAE